MLVADTESATRDLQTAQECLEASPQLKFQSILHEYRGLLHLETDPEASLREYAEAERILVETKTASFERDEIRLRRAEALLALERYPEAADEAAKGVRALEETGQNLELGHLLRAQAIATHFMGRPGEAAELFQRSEQELRNVGDQYELGRLLVDRATLVAENPNARLADAAEALSIFERIGVDHLAQQARDALVIAQTRARRTESIVVTERVLTDDIVAESEEMKAVLRDVDLAARSDDLVLVTGESGVGKEVVAQLVHAHGERAMQSMVAVNCAAVPEALFEREFFGHAKGAFTGADDTRPGFVEAAHQGTLFLDEIGELPLPLQPKLLRLLQEGSYRRVGDVQERYVDVRVVAATNQNLLDLVQRRQFREDLYYRLQCFEVDIPPLRERPRDVPALVKFFLSRESARRGIEYWMQKEAWHLLKTYDWPGNVRQLQAAVRSAATRSGPAGCVRVEDLPPAIRDQRRPRVASTTLDLAKNLDSRERELILEALRKADHQRTLAAKLLGIGRNTLYEKMKRLGIHPER